jgi:hypothetical protein
VRLGKQIDLADEHQALDDQGNGRGFITFNVHWKNDEDFMGLPPTGREGTSVETLLLTFRDHKVSRIDIADNTVELPLYLWRRAWPNPHGTRPPTDRDLCRPTHLVNAGGGRRRPRMRRRKSGLATRQPPSPGWRSIPP